VVTFFFKKKEPAKKKRNWQEFCRSYINIGEREQDNKAKAKKIKDLKVDQVIWLVKTSSQQEEDRNSLEFVE